MCGIAGLLNAPADRGASLVDAMIRALKHRGPDDQGRWFDAGQNVALGQARLAIIDLSEHGHQPMFSASGRYVAVLNGEIYNFNRLRRELDARAPHAWRGHSDTEVLLAAIDCWGLRGAIERTVGMFALAVWDRQARELFLARDRLGEKPLYYGHVGGAFAFASELKAIVAAAPARPEIDRDAVAGFVRFGYVPAPATIYRGVFKLPPGCVVRVDAAGRLHAPERYWTLDTDAQRDLARELATVGDDPAVDELEQRLRRAVVDQMVADVPLGAFLSGGVDSSTIVALMQASSPRPVRTFTIGFAESGFDEAPFAREVARHLGTDHTEMYVTAADAAGVIPALPRIYDEPFADPSQIPTALVSQLTRRQVTVSLSGDGGDELFAGYPRYQFAPPLWRRIRALPHPLRWLAAGVLQWPSASQWDKLLARLPLGSRDVSGHRLVRLAQLMTSRTFGEMYVRLVSHAQLAETLVGRAGAGERAPDWPTADTQLGWMRRWDLEQYLPDDLLVKVDRAAMHVGLESRAPLLDHRVAEFAFALPDRMLVRDGASKWLLKRLLDRYVPRKLIDRPKSGFELPLAQWLRGSLRGWADDLLSEDSVRASGLLDPRAVSRLWRDHVERRADRQAPLWNVLMLQAWLRDNAGSQVDRAPVAVRGVPQHA